MLKHLGEDLDYGAKISSNVMKLIFVFINVYYLYVM